MIKNMREEKVALVIHPSELNMFLDVVKAEKPEKNYSQEMLLKFFEWIDPFKHKEIFELSFDGKKKVNASIFLVPFMPEMTDYALNKVIEKVEMTLQKAKEDGCTVAAMAGFTSIVIQGKEDELSKKHDIRITSGNTTTAAIIIKSIMDLCKKLKRKLSTSTVTIVGASGDIGFGCFLYLGEKVEKVFLTARGLAGLEERINPVKGFFDCEIEVTTDNDLAIQQSEIVIFVTSAYSSIYHVNDFKSGTIVCDASAPMNVETGGKSRKDVFLYHGGIASLPFDVDFGFSIGLASNKHLHGCQVEGIMNALDPEIPLSLGRGNITAQKIERILKFLEKKNAPKPVFTLGNREINLSDL